MESPEFFQTAYFSDGDHFLIEELLDFPNDDAGGFDPGDSAPALDGTCNSSAGELHFQAADIAAGGKFCSDLSVPCDELAELEWLSNFVEESFSSEDLQKLHLIQGMKAKESTSSVAHQPGRMFHSDTSVPAKARSKRSRASPATWTSRLLAVPPNNHRPPSSTVADVKNKPVGPRKKEAPENSAGEGLRCLHCATDETPQWRTGPMGPKTLCNACGVRYKSGRLVPEYRPAASPTFVLTKHSNSHRKVLELRRQKELLKAQQQPHQFVHQSVEFDLSNGEDYLIYQPMGPDFPQLI